ncbi:hypothetical protein Tco_1046144, partial [Tanacetum coccineum]
MHVGGVQTHVAERVCCLRAFAVVSVSRGKKHRCQSLPQQPNTSSRWALKERELGMLEGTLKTIEDNMRVWIK